MHPGLFLPPWEQGTVPPLMFLIRECDTYITLKERREKHFCLWCNFSPEIEDSFHMTLAQGDLINLPSDEIFLCLLSTLLLLKETLAAVKKKWTDRALGNPGPCVVPGGAAGASSHPHRPLSVSLCFTLCEQGDLSSASQGIRQNSSPSAGGTMSFIQPDQGDWSGSFQLVAPVTQFLPRAEPSRPPLPQLISH